MESWHTFGRTRRADGIVLQVRIMLFHATVLAVFLSGLETYVFTPREVQRLEAFQQGRLRIILHGSARGHTADWVRRETNSPTICSSLSAQNTMASEYYQISSTTLRSFSCSDGPNHFIWPFSIR
eukprot:15561244-Heterocapsa_arctica.AAC.1